MIKKIIGLTIVIVLVTGLVASGLWAYFSDVQISSSNVLTAGTLDLSPSTSGAGPTGKYTVTPGGNGANGNVVFQKLQPGDTGDFTWVLSNNGTIPGTLAVSSVITFAENGSNEIENAGGGNNNGGNGDLDQYMGVKLQRGVGSDQAGASANLTYIIGSAGSYVAFSGLQAALNGAGFTMASNGGNDTVVYKVSWEIGSLFGGANPNIIQSDSARIDVAFTLTP